MNKLCREKIYSSRFVDFLVRDSKGPNQTANVQVGDGVCMCGRGVGRRVRDRLFHLV